MKMSIRDKWSMLIINQMELIKFNNTTLSNYLEGVSIIKPRKTVLNIFVRKKIMTQMTFANYGALITRLAFGGVLLSHGLLKVFVFTLPGAVGFFESQGFPGFTAYVVVTGEIIGGIAIMLGLYTRLAALLSIPILLGATLVHAGNGWLFTNTGGGWEYPVFLIFVAVSVALHGNGPYAIRKLPLIDAFIPRILKA
jgi:putative oxidoreductase